MTRYYDEADPEANEANLALAVSFLDEMIPGWVDRQPSDPEYIHLMDPYRCLFANALPDEAGGWPRGTVMLGTWEREHGIEGSLNDLFANPDWQPLWVRVINERRAA